MAIVAIEIALSSVGAKAVILLAGTPAPTITSVAPNRGPAFGGTSVTITGTDFVGVTAVSFGGTLTCGPPPGPGPCVTVVSATQITAISPSHVPGTVDVTVVAAGGTSATGPADQFTYVGPPTVTSLSPSTGPYAGGTAVKITGTNFIDVTKVWFMGSPAVPAPSFTVDSPTQITAISPPVPSFCFGSAIDGFKCYRTITVNVAVQALGTENGSFGVTKPFLYFAPNCTGASLTSDKTSPQPSGTQVIFTSSSVGCTYGPIFEYWTWAQTQGWVERQSYANETPFTLDTTGMAPGTYTIDAWAAQPFYGEPLTGYETFALDAWVVGGCESATLNPNPARAGGLVHFTATAAGSGCSTPEYEFWLWSPATGWVVKQPYSTSDTFDLDTSTLTAGTYTIDVWVRQRTSSTAPNYFQTWALSTVPKSACGSASLTAVQTSPQNVGGVVDFAASAAGCSNPEYRFWIYPGAGGSWQMLQDYSSNATLHWNTAQLKTGTYSLDVWVKEAGSTAAYDTFGLSSYSVTGCTTAAINANPASPQVSGTAVTISASATGCSAPQYQFWIYPGTNGGWQVLRDYSSTATYAWTPKAGGTYALVVYVRQAGSGNSYDTFQEASYSAT